MQNFGQSAARLQLAGLLTIAAILGGCSGGGNSSAATSSGASASGAPGTATLTWIPPSSNTNGTPITDLAGYHIHYGTSADNMTKVIDVPGTGTTAFEVSGLTSGTYYFAVSAYTSMGTESAESIVGSKSI